MRTVYPKALEHEGLWPTKRGTVPEVVYPVDRIPGMVHAWGIGALSRTDPEQVTLRRDGDNATRTFKAWDFYRSEVPSSDLVLWTAEMSISIDLKSESACGEITIDWGDGTTEDFTLDSSVATTVSHGYSVGGVKYIYVTNALCFSYWSSSASFGGDISNLTNLTYLSWGGNNTGSGDMSNLTNLTYLNWGGNNTGSGDMSNLTNLTYLNWGGNNTGSGDISNLTNLTYLRWQGNNTGSGDISNLTNLTYLNWGGNSTGSGFAGLTGNALGIYYFDLGNSVTLTESQVNDILINIDANKDEAKPSSTRFIDLSETNHAAPGAAGITAKNSLVAAGWTVNTN